MPASPSASWSAPPRRWLLFSPPIPSRRCPATTPSHIFLDAPPARRRVSTVSNRTNEELALGLREIYVYYPDGVGESRLKIPAAKNGTARNMNTVAKLAEMAADL